MQIQTQKPTAIEGIELYLDAKWGNESDYKNAASSFEKAYQNSLFITAREDNKLIGMIRYLTDGFHDTQIIECLVLKEFQRKGIAKKMLQALKEQYPHTDIYVQSPEKFKDAFLKMEFKKHDLIGLSFHTK